MITILSYTRNRKALNIDVIYGKYSILLKQFCILPYIIPCAIKKHYVKINLEIILIHISVYTRNMLKITNDDILQYVMTYS
jgi:hypothetical protein